jgi:hypothetical protein
MAKTGAGQNPRKILNLKFLYWIGIVGRDGGEKTIL